MKGPYGWLSRSWDHNFDNHLVEGMSIRGGKLWGLGVRGSRAKVYVKFVSARPLSSTRDGSKHSHAPIEIPAREAARM